MSNTDKYRVGSMFAGVGGICLGFKQAGAELVWANEIDRFACETYRLNFGSEYLCEGDIYSVDVDDVPDFDILVAGFPCQAFSIAGYRKGFDDKRGVLFYEVMRIVSSKRPRAVFLENVKNLKTHDNGNTYRVIRQLLENEGYVVTEAVLNTMEYGNIPQNRERIYVVAFKKQPDGSCPEMDRFSFPEKMELTKNIHDIVDVHEKKDDYFYHRFLTRCTIPIDGKPSNRTLLRPIPSIFHIYSPLRTLDDPSRWGLYVTE